MALVLGAILALLLSASAAAAQPFPKIKRAHELSCSGARANLTVTATWKKANRTGEHRGHAVALIRAQGGKIHSRKVSSQGLRRVRSQSIAYRFRFPKRASARLCQGKAKAEVVLSHGHDKDRKGLVEIYRVSRKTLGGKAGASGDAGAAANEGADCLGGGANAIIKPGAQLQKCDLIGIFLVFAKLEGANLTDANLGGATLDGADLKHAVLVRAILSGTSLIHADLIEANLTSANLTRAGFTSANLTKANLAAANLTRAILAAANLIGANLTGANLTRADCWGARKPDGSLYPAPVDPSGRFSFVQC